MKQLLGGTLALMLASFAWAAPQASPTEGKKPAKQSENKPKTHKSGKQAKSTKGKAGKAQTETVPPVK